MEQDPVRPVAGELLANCSFILSVQWYILFGTVDDRQSGVFMVGAEKITSSISRRRGPDADFPVTPGQFEEFFQNPVAGRGDVGDMLGEEPHIDGGKQRVGNRWDEFGGAEGDEPVQIVVGEDLLHRLGGVHLPGDEPDVPAGLPELSEEALQLVLQLLRVEEEVAVMHQQPDQRSLPVGGQPAFGIGEGTAAAPGDQKSFGDPHGGARDAEFLRQFVGGGNPHRLAAGAVEDRHDPVPDLLHFRDGLL